MFPLQTWWISERHTYSRSPTFYKLKLSNPIESKLCSAGNDSEVMDEPITPSKRGLQSTCSRCQGISQKINILFQIINVVNLAFSESGDSREYYGGPEFDLYESTVLKWPLRHQFWAEWKLEKWLHAAWSILAHYELKCICWSWQKDVEKEHLQNTQKNDSGQNTSIFTFWSAPIPMST